MTVTLPDKPRFNAPCNGCGVCCAEKLCLVGVIAHGDIPGPCPSLKIAPCGTKTVCSIVEKERQSGLPPMVAVGLGIGIGCTMTDDDTTDAELDEQKERMRAQARQMLPGYDVEVTTEPWP